MVDFRRGDIVIVNLESTKGSEQRGVRPCIILQNDVGNKFSPTTIIAPLTSRKMSKSYPTNVELLRSDSHLEKDSTIMLNQITTIDKSRISRKVSSLSSDLMSKVDMAIKISLSLH